MWQLARKSQEVPGNLEQFHEYVIRFLQHDKRFHEIILETAGNTRLTALIGDYRDFVTTHGAVTFGKTRDLAEAVGEHERVLRALAVNDQKRAAYWMYCHLAGTGRQLVESVKREQQAAGVSIELRSWFDFPWFDEKFGNPARFVSEP